MDEETEQVIQSLVKSGSLEQIDKYLELTQAGMLFYYSVAIELI